MFCMGKSTSFIITSSNLILSTAAFSNNLGGDTVFKGANFVFVGANLVFDVINEQWSLPVLSKDFSSMQQFYMQLMTHCQNVTGYLKCFNQVSEVL